MSQDAAGLGVEVAEEGRGSGKDAGLTAGSAIGLSGADAVAGAAPTSGVSVVSGAADLQVRRVIVETLTPQELDYFRSIRDYLSTLKQPDRERWIIMEMQKFRAEVEDDRRSSDALALPTSASEISVGEEVGDEESDAAADSPEASERQSPRMSRETRATVVSATQAVEAEIEVVEELTEEEKAFLAFQADEAKKCLNCASYCHMEGDEDFIYLPCTLCEKRICHLCKRFCYKCGDLVCINCIFTKPKTGRKYCPKCFNDTRLNDRVLKCEVCFMKVEIDERIISCWRCYSVACMKTCGRYSVDGFICRRCINEMKEQEELRNQEAEGEYDEDIVAGAYDENNVNALKKRELPSV